MAFVVGVVLVAVMIEVAMFVIIVREMVTGTRWNWMLWAEENDVFVDYWSTFLWRVCYMDVTFCL